MYILQAIIIKEQFSTLISACQFEGNELIKPGQHRRPGNLRNAILLEIGFCRLHIYLVQMPDLIHVLLNGTVTEV